MILKLTQCVHQVPVVNTLTKLTQLSVLFTNLQVLLLSVKMVVHNMIIRIRQ